MPWTLAAITQDWGLLTQGSPADEAVPPALLEEVHEVMFPAQRRARVRR